VTKSDFYAISSRPTLLDFLLLLLGCGGSLYLVRLGPLWVEPGEHVTSPVLYEVVASFLPTLMRLPEGVLLLGPLFFLLQLVLGRRQGPTGAEWLWVLAWLGTAALTGLSAWARTDTVPEIIEPYVHKPLLLWYLIFVPAMAALALVLAVLGLASSTPKPWTHQLGLALILWPALPLGAIFTLGNFTTERKSVSHMTPSVLGLDVGGANLKAAHTDGTARSRPFALWKDPASLPAALAALLAEMPRADWLAVTMTGELCDCFETKRAGVAAILAAVESAAGGLPVRVWRTDGRFVSPAEARQEPLQTAAANWLALATFAGRLAPEGPALLVDVGSTTTDVIPLRDGRPVPRALTDAERLPAQELVYTGTRRTPVCALVQQFVAAEVFATTLDVYLLLGRIPEDESDRDTADGRPATRRRAHSRLARMFGSDGELMESVFTHSLACLCHSVQWRLLRDAFTQVGRVLEAKPAVCVLSGSGEFLARDAWAGDEQLRGLNPLLSPAPPEGRGEPDSGPRLVSLSERLGPEISRAACAYAVAVLAAETEG
jgi:probable H4MPT-linked C1 transfer pathway protein